MAHPKSEPQTLDELAAEGDAMDTSDAPESGAGSNDATADELEKLGEDVRKRVYAATGITLEWEILRIGRIAPKDPVQQG